MLVVDYYSRFVEVVGLKTMEATEIIQALKSIFARFGIPEMLVSDNGPQYVATQFMSFAEKYGFIHVTSLPKYPQSNGAAERAVQTVKRLMAKSTDFHLALLAYRSSPLDNGYSPAELLMGRKLRSTIPTLPQVLKPETPLSGAIRERVSQTS